MNRGKLDRDKDKVTEHFISKELEMIGKKIEDVKDDKEWYRNNTLTNEQYWEWKEYCENYLRKNYRFTIEEARREMTWFGLMYGLRIKG